MNMVAPQLWGEGGQDDPEGSGYVRQRPSLPQTIHLQMWERIQTRPIVPWGTAKESTWVLEVET